MNLIPSAIVTEFQFSTSRSGGAGGQHVNTTESRVEIKFHVGSSYYLTDEQKALISKKLENKLDTEGYLRMYDSSSRSQHTNKEKLVKKVLALLESSLKQPKKRKPTKMSKSTRAKRRKGKERRSDIKKLRKRSFDY